MRITKPIVFIGLMGAGKTAIGSRVAELLGVPFIDTDHMIEMLEGKTVSEIFAQKGEPYFREVERKVMQDVLEGKWGVLSTGGGAFMQPETRALLLAGACVVWLRAPLDVLVERTARKSTRPLLEKGDKREILEKLMEVRYPVYAEAHIAVDSSQAPHEHVVGLAMNALKAHQVVV